jgi:beta-N-acetylhexosaminidase
VRIRSGWRIAFGLVAVGVAVAAWLIVVSGDGQHAARRFDRNPRRTAGLPRLRRSAGGVFPAPAHVITRTVAPTRERMLGLDRLAGQRVIYAYSGLQPPASLFRLIRAGEAAGVIFFPPNIASATQLRTVISELQRASMASPLHIRLLTMLDQEGGEVRRLPGAPVLSERQLGESTDPAVQARTAGVSAGQNLASAGVNVNLAPVLDVYRQPGNFIDQFQRSYSSNPADVSSLGAQFIAAQQRVGVAATAKHFPGLGAATQSQNTDVGPVVLDQDLAVLRNVDETPYTTAIAAGVKLMMTSWAIYPALDPRLPAGLSPTIIQGELRDRLGFQGVTITDGIDAGAATRFGSLAQRGVLAAKAGADLILCAAPNPSDNTPAMGADVMHAIAAAIARHIIPADTARQAARRILSLRERP